MHPISNVIVLTGTPPQYQQQSWESHQGNGANFEGPRRRQLHPAPPPMNRMTVAKMSVSNQTNSSDPNSVNSRVFVGNLNTYIVNKDQVERMFAPYGRVAGISMHKGYAFVQYTNQYDARNAVASMDHRVICGQILDVNIVSEPKPHQAGRKRQNVVVSNNDWNQKQPAAKKPARAARQKAVDEPDAFLCYMCKERIVMSFDLLQHIQSTHNITLYEEIKDENAEFGEEQGEDELNGADTQAA